MKKLWVLPIAAVSIVGLSLFILVLIASDIKYGQTYVFEFKVKDLDGKLVRDAGIFVVGGTEEGIYNFSYEVSTSDEAYSVRYRWMPRAPAYYAFLPKKEPEKFSFSIEKEGLSRRSVQFTLDELNRQYLKESGEEMFIYILPDVVLEEMESVKLPDDSEEYEGAGKVRGERSDAETTNSGSVAPSKPVHIC